MNGEMVHFEASKLSRSNARLMMSSSENRMSGQKGDRRTSMYKNRRYYIYENKTEQKYGYTILNFEANITTASESLRVTISSVKSLT